MVKWVYTFGQGKAEGDGSLGDLLGGKGAHLAEMARLGLPVPPGFTITTEVCRYFYESGKQFPPDLKNQVEAALGFIGELTGRRFGDPRNPLLVSTRSGAKASMPGMMDTVLNLGLNDVTVEALARQFDDERFAYDSYRRFIQMYANVTLGIEHHEFEEILEFYKEKKGVSLDTELSSEDLKRLVAEFKAKVEKSLGQPFPQDPHEQLWGAISAVFGSWMNPRAEAYRRMHNISPRSGTAVNIQAMVFGNMGETSATGVAFTRSPSTGVKELFGEFLLNAQGEDVVAGLRTPQNITEAARVAAGSEQPSMESALPEVFAEFVRATELLEKHYREMQDVEFTVERGKLWMLQTRTGKRTTAAALRIAVDMTNEGLISKEEALNRVVPASLEQVLHPALDPNAPRQVIATGLPASPGAASGEIVFNSSEAEQVRSAGRKAILVRVETSPEDIQGMHAAEGILTTRGGMTSHAAVVARGMGKPCVSGAATVRINYTNATLTASGMTFNKGDLLTIDGTTGQVMKGIIEMHQPELSNEFTILMEWADAARRMDVRANADTPRDARVARRFGAHGIGLCRTEHMFFEDGRIVPMREMILAVDEEGRRAALAKLLPMQRADFAELFEIMAGLPVTIRLLDPPLHEFLPRTQAEISDVAKAMGVSLERLTQRTAELSEVNPMLGFRGARLAIAYPEIAEMQARAIFEGAIMARAKTGMDVRPEIMTPLIVAKAEFDLIKSRVDAIAQAVAAEMKQTIAYSVGTMIETPRASLRAGDLAQSAEFFSFGTNDLTQTCLALSRDDAGSFLAEYAAKGILPGNPFSTIDREGAGELIEIACRRGRQSRPSLKIGLCGEHAGDPSSIDFFEIVGLDYVSCSPFRVPIARLAAAQAALRRKAARQA
ncbi:pyruvate, phosphate dikinase [Beijerinckiaceae bacterium]|nr:pyruvate, phosphate dikinase [Beijerinckiaceae bacterium]